MDELQHVLLWAKKLCAALPWIHNGPRARVSLAVLLLRAAAAKRWSVSTQKTSARRAAVDA
tara:strand:- start:276 stop:458 length:183 start_codon:yes stop_codon:yes gene_type:complete